MRTPAEPGRAHELRSGRRACRATASRRVEARTPARGRSSRPRILDGRRPATVPARRPRRGARWWTRRSRRSRTICRAVAGFGRNRSLTRSRASRSAMIARASPSVTRASVERRAVARDAAAEPVANDGTFRREHRCGIDGLVGSQHHALEHRRGSRTEVTGQRRGPSDIRLRDPLRAERATRTRRKRDLALAQRLVERLAGNRRCVAELRVSRPEIHARCGGLVGIVPATEKLGHPHDQMPSTGVSAATCFAASASSLTNSSHADFGFSPCRPPCPGADWNCNSSATRPAGIPIAPKRATSARMPLRIDTTGPRRPELGKADRPGRGEVDLPDQDRGLGRLTPPVRGLAAGIRRVRDRDRRRRPERLELLQQRQHVRAVLRIRRAPRGRRLGAEELVLGDQRRRAAGHLDGEVEQPLRLVGDRRRVRRCRRRADAIVQMEIEEDGRSTGRPHLRRDHGAGRDRERRAPVWGRSARCGRRSRPRAVESQAARSSPCRPSACRARTRAARPRRRRRVQGPASRESG